MKQEDIRTYSPLIALILTLFLICVIWFFNIEPAKGQTDFFGVIRDSGGEVAQLNIAVANFAIDPSFFTSEDSANAVRLSRMVEDGLAFSLYFNVIHADSVVIALIGKENFSYDDWIFLGAEHLVGGKFSSDGVRYHLNLEISDILRGKVIYKQEFNSALDSLTQLAYKTVDKIINILTGEIGISHSKIVFSLERKDTKELAMCNWDGLQTSTISNTGTINLFPASDISGDNIFFTSYLKGNPDLYKLNLNSLSMVPISARRGINSSPAISPDGKHIALTLTVDNNAELYLLDMKGNIIRRLTKSWGIEGSPSFSPSGKEIVFSSDRSGNVHLYITDLEGINKRKLTYRGSYNDTPSWSPKGDIIAFASREKGEFQIYTMTVTGEKLKKLTFTGNNQDPCFSPDGLHICFVSNRNGNQEVYTMNFDGSNQRRVTTVKHAFNPYWMPGKEGR